MDGFGFKIMEMRKLHCHFILQIILQPKMELKMRASLK